MDISISSDNRRFIEQSLESGQYSDSQALFDEAIRLLKRRDDLIRAVNDGVDQLDQEMTVDGESLLDRLSDKYRPATDTDCG